MDTNDFASAFQEDHPTIRTLNGGSVTFKESFEEPKFIKPEPIHPCDDMTPMVVEPATATTKQAPCATIQDTEDEILDEDQSDSDSEYLDNDKSSEADEGEYFCAAHERGCLSPELMELAHILESNGNNHFPWDWDIIDQEATPMLKALINSKRRSSMHKNPMQVLVGNSATPLFQAYRVQLRKGRKDYDAHVGTQAMGEQSGRKLTFDPRASTKDQQGEITKVVLQDCASQRRSRRAACSNFLNAKTDHVLDCDTVSNDEPVMKKIRHTKRTKFLVVEKAQSRAAHLLTRGETGSAPSGMKQQIRLTSNGVAVANKNVSQAGLATGGETVATHVRVMTKQARLASHTGTTVPTESARQAGQATKGEIGVALSPMNQQTLLAYSRDLVPTEIESNMNQLSSEVQELAGLLATTKGRSWAYIETQASPRLKSYIHEIAQADPSYISMPIISLVPPDAYKVFNEFVEMRRSIEREKKQHDDFPAVADEIEETHQRGNTKHRELGQKFAIERKRRITTMTANLRAQLVAFEEQEVTLWNSFLQG